MTKTIEPLLVRNGLVLTLGKTNQVLPGHSVLIEAAKISRIAPDAEFRTYKGAEIQARGKAVLPGFINTHMHFYSTFARGLIKADPSRDFNEILRNLWWRLDRKLTLEDSYMSAMIPLIDCIRKGTTTVIDHHASPGAIRGSLQAIANAVQESGLRAALCYEVSDRDGAEITEQGLLENVEFIKECHRNPSDKLKGLFGLHASFTVSDQTLKRAVELAFPLNAGFHVHTAEALSDQEECLRNHGIRVVERFRKFGILGPNTICAHCVHVDENEMDLLARTGTSVVHNPQSNMNNAVGVANVPRMVEKGICVGLGTDAMTVDMLEEARSAVWAQRLGQRNPSVGFVEAMQALTLNNGRIADRHWNLGLGELKAGGAADIAILDYIPPTPIGPENVLGHICFGLAESQVDTTICGGTVLMQAKELKIPIDEERISARSRELASSLWARF